MVTKTVLCGLCITVCNAVAVEAGVCNYRPSEVLGSGATTTTAIAAGSASAIGAGAKAAGVYTLVHASSGLTMVGGTWAGTSAAGTAGILAGTGGSIGTAVAFITAPATIAVGAVAAVGITAFEGACFFADTRIADYDEVDAIMRDIAVNASKEYFRYSPGKAGATDGKIFLRSPDGIPGVYDVFNIDKLYIVNGVLKYRDWGLNTTIGLIGQIKG